MSSLFNTKTAPIYFSYFNSPVKGFLYSIIFTAFFFTDLSGQNLSYSYPYHQVVTIDKADGKDGYWLFYPENSSGSLDLVVFMHGYGAYDPFIYGGWIEHIVKQGNVVIFPRYQTNIWHPRASKFPKFANKGITSALEYLKTQLPLLTVKKDSVSYVGHSYGGVIITNLLSNSKRFKLPKPKVVLLCTPGSGPLKGARLKRYDKIDPSVRLVTISAERDEVVGDEFSRLLIESTPQLEDKWWFHKLAVDSLGFFAGHNECYSLSMAQDFGLRNYTAKKAIRIGKTDKIDFHLFWEIFDDLRAISDLKDFPRAYYTAKWEDYNYLSGDLNIKTLESLYTPLKKIEN